MSGIDLPAGSRPRTDNGVDLIDEQDDVAALVNFLKNLLQAFLKVTAVAGTGDERPGAGSVRRGAVQFGWAGPTGR